MRSPPPACSQAGKARGVSATSVLELRLKAERASKEDEVRTRSSIEVSPTRSAAAAKPFVFGGAYSRSRGFLSVAACLPWRNMLGRRWLVALVVRVAPALFGRTGT